MTLDDKTTPTDVARAASSRDVNHKPNLKHSQSAQFQMSHVAHGPPSVSSDQISDDMAWRLHLRSSDTFEKIMTDIEGKMVEQVKKQQELASLQQAKGEELQGAVVVEKKSILLELDEEDEEDTEQQKRLTHNSPIRIKARRAWGLIRRHIREEAMNKQTSSSLQWSMLKHTLKNMSNMDAAREELYKKYLDPDKPRTWTDGMKSIPQGFFAKHTRAVLKKPLDKSPPASHVERKKSSKRRHNSYRL